MPAKPRSSVPQRETPTEEASTTRRRPRFPRGLDGRGRKQIEARVKSARADDHEDRGQDTEAR